MKINTDILKQLFQAVLATSPDEIGCGKCYEQIEEFVEIKLEGKSAEAAMPLVEDHLKLCQECREEYEALLKALENIDAAAK